MGLVVLVLQSSEMQGRGSLLGCAGERTSYSNRADHCWPCLSAYGEFLRLGLGDLFSSGFCLQADMKIINRRSAVHRKDVAIYV